MVRSLADPTAITNFWDGVMDSISDLIGIIHKRNAPLRLVLGEVDAWVADSNRAVQPCAIYLSCCKQACQWGWDPPHLNYHAAW